MNIVSPFIPVKIYTISHRRCAICNPQGKVGVYPKGVKHNTSAVCHFIPVKIYTGEDLYR